MPVSFIRPADPLVPYIDRYWLFSNTPGTSFIPHIMPGAGTDLFIHLAESFTHNTKEKLPVGHIVFSGERSSKMQLLQNVRFIAVRFKAGALKNFTNIPFTSLLESFATPEEIWNAGGKDLLSAVLSAESTDAIVKQLNNFLTRQLQVNRKSTPGWDFVIDRLYRSYDSVTIDELSGVMNLSNRHFRRRFIEETAFSPKHFQQLARFHATLKPLLLRRQTKYLSTALANGYFDQTHFIKEFKYFVGNTPSEYLKEKNFMSHFYYPSLPGYSSFVKKN